MKIVILCGGKGTRLIEKTTYIPKPLAEIGGKPILIHLLKRYLYYGFNKFLLLLGYKGKKIIEYFNNQRELGYIDIKSISKTMNKEKLPVIQFLDTGINTPIWQRLLLSREKIKDKIFMANYSDGLADVDISNILKFHKSHKRIGTVVIVKPHSQYGKIILRSNNFIKNFVEKPIESFWVNGGFFIFNREVYDYLNEGVRRNIQPLTLLARDNQLIGYRHNGFWKCMDTFKDLNEFNELYQKGEAKWLQFNQVK